LRLLELRWLKGSCSLEDGFYGGGDRWREQRAGSEEGVVLEALRRLWEEWGWGARCGEGG
jgi:hypothetical protein